MQIVSPAEDIISKRVLVHELNLHTATDAELDFDVNFKLVIDMRLFSNSHYSNSYNSSLYDAMRKPKRYA